MVKSCEKTPSDHRIVLDTAPTFAIPETNEEKAKSRTARERKAINRGKRKLKFANRIVLITGLY